MIIRFESDTGMAILSRNLKDIAIVVIAVQVLCLRFANAFGETEKLRDLPEELDFYSYPAVDIFDNIVSLEKYRGEVSLVVNVASQCGYTDSHYKGLTLLQELFSETKKFNILAFPCNQFGDQEPGTQKDIYHFAYNTMGANFPLFAKINVLEHDIPPAWSYLMKHSGHVPSWNFWKYLVNHKGHVIGAWGPSTTPETLYQQIKEAINAIDDDDDDDDGDNNKDEDREDSVKDEF